MQRFINTVIKYAVSSTQVPIKASRKIKFKNQKNPELMSLKKQLALKQPKIGTKTSQQDKLYKEYDHREIYKVIDTNIESFFYKRDYSIDNFNFLMNLIGVQKKPQLVDLVLQKMRLLKIYPDISTYNYIIKAYSLSQNVKAAQKYFKQASEKFLPNVYIYNTLIQCYTINNDPEMAIAIMREMREKGIIPNLPVYTTVINSFRIGRKLEKCWQLNKQVRQSGLQLDQTYVGVMLKVYAATHDAQKAVKMYNQEILDKGIKAMVQTKNSYFKALASRPEYAERVIDSFYDMVEQGRIVNNETVRWALKACATKGNIRDAGQILKIARMKQIEIDKPIYNCLLRIYANACKQALIGEQTREVIIIDSWKLVQQIKKKEMLDVTILNNLMLVYTNSLRDRQVQGLILPLYQKNNIPYNVYTYQFLMEMYFNKQDFTKVMRIYQNMQKDHQQKLINLGQQKGYFIQKRSQQHQQNRASFKICDLLLQVGIRLLDMRVVLDTLELYKRMGRTPKNSHLKFLGNLENVPQQIVASLMDFKIKFGKAKVQNTNKNVQDPQNI